MIIRTVPLDNPWKRGAISSFMWNYLTILCFLVVYNITGQENDVIGVLSVCNLIFSLMLYFIGFVNPIVERVKFFVAILGLFCIFPVLIFCVAPFFLFLTLSNFSKTTEALLTLLYVILSVIWCVRSIIQTMRVEKKFSYIARQVKLLDGIACIDRERARDFSRYEKRKKNKGATSKLIPLLLPMIYAGYPLQRLITGTLGHAVFMAFLSILSVPLSFYFMGKMSAGYYLWIYLIGRFERKIGAAIFLSSSNRTHAAKRQALRI